jgi:acetyl-CoA C-acetyltransferase
MWTIKDKVAIVGMGCCKFGENWDKGADDMIIDATYEAYEDAGVERKDIQAAWVGTTVSGAGGITIAAPLKLDRIPITHVQNFCATGMETIRSAAFAIACGAYDIVLCVGYEKLKDSGLAGLPAGYIHPVLGVNVTAPGRWAMGAVRYFQAYGLSPKEGKETLAKISVKNHYNGARHPKAHLRREVTLEQVLNAPMIAWPLGLFDCCGNTDGAAAAILTRADIAKNFRDDYVLVKGIGLAIGPALGKEDGAYDYIHLPETEVAAQQAYEQAGIKNPRKELDILELHDCFTISELMTLEAIGICPKGKAKEDIDAGTFTLKGELPVNADGGLKSFGHPIGASGVRECYEIYKQIQGKAELPERQLKKEVRLGLSHNQGGHPGSLLPIVTILGRKD